MSIKSKQRIKVFGPFIQFLKMYTKQTFQYNIRLVKIKKWTPCLPKLYMYNLDWEKWILRKRKLLKHRLYRYNFGGHWGHFLIISKLVIKTLAVYLIFIKQDYPYY